MEEILQKKMKKRIIRKWRLNFMSILLLFVIIFVINSCANYQEQKKCIGSDGKWTSFDNSGADICGQQDSGVDVTTQSCDCGPNKCWNRENCVIDDCVSRWKMQLKSGYGTQAEIIIVKFLNNVSVDEASQIIFNYNLTYDLFLSYDYNQILINVPIGSEANWICIFSNLKEVGDVRGISNEKAI